jgi:site-specific recombinase XerD
MRSSTRVWGREELRRRNFADTTIRSYLHGVEHFSQHFHRRPDQLGTEEIRKYQALFTTFKFSPNTVILRLAALRFFYIHVLKRGWSIAKCRSRNTRMRPPPRLRSSRLLFTDSIHVAVKPAYRIDGDAMFVGQSLPPSELWDVGLPPV